MPLLIHKRYSLVNFVLGFTVSSMLIFNVAAAACSTDQPEVPTDIDPLEIAWRFVSAKSSGNDFVISIELSRPIEITVILDESDLPDDVEMPSQSGVAQFKFNDVKAGHYALRITDSFGNSQSRTVRAGPPIVRRIKAGQPNRVTFGQTIRLENSTLEVKFTGVQSDFRCPTDSICPDDGYAIINIDVSTLGKPVERKIVNVPLHGPGTFQIDSMTGSLSDLEPLSSSTRSISEEAYSIVISIE